MNDNEMETLLDELKRTACPADGAMRPADDFICELRRRLARRRRRLWRAVATIAVVGAAVIATAVWGARHPAVDAGGGDAADGLLAAEALFPETGVALVNGEVVTCEQEGLGRQANLFQLRFHGPDGSCLAAVEFTAAEDDTIAIADGAVTGSLLVSHCAHGETIIDLDLTIVQNDDGNLRLKELLAITPAGVIAADGQYGLTVSRHSLPHRRHAAI